VSIKPDFPQYGPSGHKAECTAYLPSVASLITSVLVWRPYQQEPSQREGLGYYAAARVVKVLVPMYELLK